MVTLQEVAEAFNLNKGANKADFSAYGEVKSINPDNTYQVSLNGSATTIKCARLTGAKVGDTVLVTVLKNGYAVVTGCVGGDTDAADAYTAAENAATAITDLNQYFWYKDADGTTAVPLGAYITEIPREDFDDAIGGTPAGGNLLLQSNAVKLRMAAVTLAELTGSALTLHATKTLSLSAQGLKVYAETGSATTDYCSIIPSAQKTTIEAKYTSGGSIKNTYITLNNDTGETCLGAYDGGSNEAKLIVNHSNGISTQGNFTSSGTITANSTITAKNHTTPIGTIVPANSPNSQTRGSSTSFAGIACQVSLPPGKYIITGSVRFANDQNGRRAVRIYDTTSSAELVDSIAIVPAVYGDYTTVKTSAVIDNSGTTNHTYALQCYQNSNSTLNTVGHLKAIRIE